MNEEPVSDALLRQFLLGQVDDQERQRLESMFVTGALSRERVMAAEQHLLDDFLDDSLTPEDRERFLAQYGETPAEQRKLRIAQSIHDWAATSAPDVGAAAGGTGKAEAHRGWQRILRHTACILEGDVLAGDHRAVRAAVIAIGEAQQAVGGDLQVVGDGHRLTAGGGGLVGDRVEELGIDGVEIALVRLHDAGQAMKQR